MWCVQGGEKWGLEVGREGALPWNRLSALAPWFKLPGSHPRWMWQRRVNIAACLAARQGVGHKRVWFVLCTAHLAPADLLFSFSSCISVSGTLGWASSTKWGTVSSFSSQFCYSAFAVLHWFSYLPPFWHLIVTPFLSFSSPLPCFPLQSQCPGGFMFGFFFNFLSRRFHLSLQIIFNKGLAWSNLFSISSPDLK